MLNQLNSLLNHRLWIVLVVSLLSLLPASQSYSKNSQRSSYPEQAYPAIHSIRDPFTPSGMMFDALTTRGSASGAPGYGFMRSPSNSELPPMRLRGYIGKTDNKPVALLEIDNKRTYIVHEGDEINIDPSVPNSAIRITKITRYSVTVEAGMLGSIRVQR